MRRETQAGVLSAAELDLGSENRPRSETPGSVNGNKRGKTQGGLTFIGSLSRSMCGGLIMSHQKNSLESNERSDSAYAVQVVPLQA